jgi:hypothetical protein
LPCERPQPLPKKIITVKTRKRNMVERTLLLVPCQKLAGLRDRFSAVGMYNGCHQLKPFSLEGVRTKDCMENFSLNNIYCSYSTFHLLTTSRILSLYFLLNQLLLILKRFIIK